MHIHILCGMYFGVVKMRLALNAQRHTICQDKQLCRGLQITFYYYDLELRMGGGSKTYSARVIESESERLRVCCSPEKFDDNQSNRGNKMRIIRFTVIKWCLLILLYRSRSSRYDIHNQSAMERGYFVD